MHFWIDKRSQSCGFGRARVGASLSNCGGVGLGFGHHPPRRLTGATKSMTIPAPIHRLQSQNYTRPTHLQYQHSNNCQYPQNTGGHLANQTNQNTSTNRQIRNNRQNSRNNMQQPQAQVPASAAPTQQHFRNYHVHVAQQQQRYQPQHQDQLILENYETPPHGGMRNHHYQNCSIDSTNNFTLYNQNLIQTANLIQNSQTTAAHNSSASNSVPLPHLYGGSSHHAQQEQELEQGTMGTMIAAARNHPATSSASHQHSSHRFHHHSTVARGGTQHGIIESSELQLLPSHLKCGMWASLVLASVFVAGAKFYFDHQGTGLEVLIFCAFSAIFFLAACTVSLCRLPRDLATTPTSTIIDSTRDIDDSLNGVTIGNHTNHLYINNPDQLHHDSQLLAAANAAPPPYHIAILLPNRSKEFVELDETPPPSYDKIII